MVTLSVERSQTRFRARPGLLVVSFQMLMKREEPPDNGFAPLARYERGVMTLLFILAAAVSALIIWLGWVFLS
jgi:hypothetical protein